MKGFEAWVAGPWSTLALGWAALAVGTVLGWGLGRRPRGVSRRERLVLADAAAERAARQFRQLRCNCPRGMKYHAINCPVWPGQEQRRTSTAAFLEPTPYGAVMFAAVAPELAHEWEPAHVGQALDVANETLSIDWADCCVCGKPTFRPYFNYQDQPFCGPCADGRPLDVGNGDPITTGEIRAIEEDMDVFMGRLLGEHPVPYPDGSGQ